MTRDEIAAAAAVGAALLDRVEPGWAERVESERLDLRDVQTCVLGQVYGSFSEGSEVVFGAVFDDQDSEWAIVQNHGFAATRHRDYSVLTHVWRAEVERRREGA